MRGRFTDDAGRAPFGQRRAYLLQDFTGSIFNPYHNYSRMEYEANSVLPTPPPAAVREAGSDYPPAMRETYLQLPALDPRIPELAKQITARDNTPYDKARSIEGYLRSHYGYTLDLSGPPQADPLAYFLFQKRAGHCEYFAAAMTVMLRSLGIPARYINGFQTGEYNDVGGDLVVRASDAHSWVEAYFPGFGWLTFDPTPPSDENAARIVRAALALLGLVRAAVERVGHQLRFRAPNYAGAKPAPRLARLDRAASSEFSSMRRRATSRLELWQYRVSRSPAGRTEVFLIFGVFVVAVLILRPEVRRRLLLMWRMRVLPARKMTPHLATLQYNEMLRVLARGGIRKTDAQTPMEFAASLPDGNLAAPVLELTAMYQAARFGGKPADPQHASSLLDRIHTFLRKK